MWFPEPFETTSQNTHFLIINLYILQHNIAHPIAIIKAT